MDQKIDEYLKNWDSHWQNYLRLNPDVKNAGITCKKKSKNHYIKCGIAEGRKVEDNSVISTFVPHTTTSNPIQSSVAHGFILTKAMFKEKI